MTILKIAKQLLALRQPRPPDTPDEFHKALHYRLPMPGAPADLHRDVAEDWEDDYERKRQALEWTQAQDWEALVTDREARMKDDLAAYTLRYPALLAVYEASLAVYEQERTAIVEKLPADLQGNERATAERLCEIYVRHHRKHLPK